MRFHAKRITVWLISSTTACLFIISIFQYNAEFEVFEKRDAVPWVKNFHQEVQHKHAAELGKPPGRAADEVRQPPAEYENPDDDAIAGEGEGNNDHGRQPKKTINEVDVKIEVPSAVKMSERLYPYGHETEDRVLKQLDYKMETTREMQIYVSGGIPTEVARGRKQFSNDKCSVQNCYLHSDPKSGETADAVLFMNYVTPSRTRPKNQIWAVYMLESPYHTTSLSGFENQLNFTATYRRDSTIVTPYERFTFFKNFTKLPEKPSRNYHAGKTKKVAWFVSNCRTPNGRMDYVKELQTHINVDIYGHCGGLKCPRSKATDCYDKLNKEYMFYLAFENSNCKDYITEKFFWNALGNNVIPVVMGARPEDYRLAAPPGSFIHVDDFESPKKLAQYLLKVAANETLYNSYFLWHGTGEFINTKFWCRLCTMVHYAQHHSVTYKDPQKWWHGPGICIKPDDHKLWSSWRGKDTRVMYPDEAQYGYQLPS